MRLFLLSWPIELKLAEVSKALVREGHSIVYWSVFNLNGRSSLQTEFPDTIFHDHEDAQKGIPAKTLEHTSFPPIGRKRLQELCGVESVVLSMMSKRFEETGVEERKRLYYTLLRYWEGVIEMYKPEAMVFPALPHSIYDYILYELARQKNIKTVLFEGSVIGDRMLVSEDFRVGNPQLLSNSWRNLRGKVDISNLSLDVRKYYEKQRAHTVSKTAPEFRQTTYKAVEVLLSGRYSKAKIRERRQNTVIRSIKDLSFLKLLVRFFATRFGDNMKKEYTSLEASADVSRDFVYVPLHYQPEQSTITQGDVFVDQRLMIEILSKTLPKDWLIYVKEHPYQWLARGTSFFSLRPSGYYRSLVRLPNVRLVPVNTNTYELIRHAKTVATVAGAAAWEAVMQGKGALIFGYVWFQHGPGIFKASDVETSREAFKTIQSGHVVSEEELLAFLSVFDKVSFRGYLDEEWSAASDLSLEDNINNVQKVLLSMLKR